MAAVIDRTQRAAAFPVTAPVGGLNAVSPLAAMPPGDASVMVNMFPYGDRVDTRPGFVTLATASVIGKTGTSEGFVRLLMHVGGGLETAFGAYYYFEDVAGTGRSRLKIYSIDSAGTLTSSRNVVTLGSTDSLTCVGEWTQFTSAAGTTYMVLMTTIQTIAPAYTCTPQAYDGSSWSAPAITGLPEIAQGTHSHRNRLWFYGCDSVTGTPKPLSAFYLPIGAIAGAVTEFNLGAFANKGGTIVSMRTWSLDNGDGGTDDMAVFVTDQGQILIYQGTDPASASTWRLVGVFNVGKLGGWCSSYRIGGPFSIGNFVRDAYAMKYGNDVVVITQDGPTSVQRVYSGAKEIGEYTLSAKISPLFPSLARGFKSIPYFIGWKMTYAPALQHFIVCIPTGYTSGSGVISINLTLYVMNSSTGAWTTYSALNVTDTIIVNGAVYAISNTRSDLNLTVSKFDGTAVSDAGATITFECRQAYNYLQSPDNKLVPMVQPVVGATGAYTLTINLDTDFVAGTIASYTSYTGATQAWLSGNSYGKAHAIHFQGQTSVGVVSWYATNLAVRRGGLV